MSRLVAVVVLVAASASCDNTTFKDCAIACNATSGCPDGLICGREGFCRIDGTTASCAELEDADPSCTCSDANTLACMTGPTVCPLGCVDEPTAPARCRYVAPSNGLGLDHLTDVSTEITVAGGTATFDTDTGAITGVVARAPGEGVRDGIAFGGTATIGVFTLHRLVVASTGTIRFKGGRAAAFVVETSATIDGVIDGTGGCAGVRSCAGPGGGTGGGTTAATGCGPGGPGFASPTSSDDGGGGGGGAGTAGAIGGLGGGTGTAGTPGTACIAPTAEPLVGGGGGGAGAQGSAASIPVGGGGGGAFQLTALDQVTIAGTINMGGAGGTGGGPVVGTGSGGAAGGAGGGAGGAILVEGLVVTISGVLAANGGGGGAGGQNSMIGGDGQPGGATANRAPGGVPPSGSTGLGGQGGAASLGPAVGGADINNAGGGGGAAGAVFLRAAGTPATTGAVISPAPGTGPVRAN